jgi:mono/diheme cytochrome c family protein
MKIPAKFAMGLVACTVLLLPPLKTMAADEKQEPKALFEKRCSKCHGLDRANRTETPDTWKALVRKMKDKWFSGISDAEAEIITRYLSETRSKK